MQLVKKKCDMFLLLELNAIHQLLICVDDYHGSCEI